MYASILVRVLLCAAALLTTGVARAQDDWQAGAGDDWRQVLAAAKKEGKVVVAGHPALSQPFTDGFKKDTGLELVYLGGTPRDLSARLVREAQAGTVTTDISLGGGTELLSMYPHGLLKAVEPQLLLPKVRDPQYWVDKKIHWLDNEGKYLMRGSRYVAGWPVVNPTMVNPAALTSWKDLLKPEYKGKIAAHDPRSGGPGQGVAAYIADHLGIDFVKSLFLGQEVRYTREDQQLVEWAARGTYPIVLGSIQEVVEKFRREGLPLAAVAPEDGRGYLASGFSTLKQPKGSPNPNAATVFINWYASKPGQELYSRTMLEASTRADVDASQVPAYILPKPGVDYLDTFKEDWYTQVRPKVTKLVVEALGGK